MTAGDDWAAEFTAIYDGNRGRLVRWLTGIFGARNAEDIAQETLARLYARPELLAADADAWPWLAVVARNVGRDLARREAHTTPVDATTLDAFPADATVHDTVVAREDAARLRRALRRVSPRDRVLLLLRDVDGTPVGDIAVRLGVNDNAVRQQLFRARRRLATVYVELGGDRRAGAVTLLGLKLRELARKYARFLEPIGTGSSAVVAGAGRPAVAAVAGALGAMLFPTPPGSPPPAPVYAAASPAPAPATQPATTPPPAASRTASRPPAPPAPAPGRVAPPADPTPFVHLAHELGPARAGGWSEDPFDRRPGQGAHWEVSVEAPGAGRVYVLNQDQYSYGGGPACQPRVACPTAVPVPYGGRPR